MSNIANSIEAACEYAEGCAALELIVLPKDKELGGFTVRRLLPSAKRQRVGPWIFFDHMGPTEFAAGTGINVRPHPHINLATVSYLFEGEILHRDSLGSVQPIRAGDINLMVAGKGIVHSERERPEVTAVAHRLHGLQLWLMLPEEHEEIEPDFLHYAAAEIPKVDVNGVPVRVMIGQAYGVSSPVKTFAETLYVEAQLEAGQSLRLPEAQERALYVVSGAVQLHSSEIKQHAMAIFGEEAGISITANTDARIAIIGGEAMPKRHIAWNFVSSRPERIAQAKQDWLAQRFPKVPGDDQEYIPLP